MITVRHGNERGKTNIGWLDSHHTFSFNRYYDPNHMGFHHLRVINEDTVAPGAGFGTHGHQDMEIVTYVLDGELAHKDSTSSEGATIRPGEVQRMTAGTGIRHSEFNASQTEPVYFFQIWILPEEDGLKPGYEQKYFSPADRSDTFVLVAARDGRDGALKIHQDVDVSVARVTAGKTLDVALAPGRHGWVQTASNYGGVTINGVALRPGDAAAVSGEAAVSIAATDGDAEIIFFDTAEAA
jgi:quercetin 2,3-dioxygenase